MKLKTYILITLFALASFVPVSGQGEDNHYVIIFDEAHKQFFDQDMMSTSLNSLANALGVNITIKSNTDAFNSTSLQGADLVIITNPGMDGNKPVTVKDGEREALQHMVDKGGSVFYMSNPYSTNVNISGHASPLNDMILPTSSAKIWNNGVSDTDNTSLIVDDFNNDGNDTHVILDQSNFNLDVLTTEINTISSVLAYSAWVLRGTGSDYYSNFSSTAFPVTKDYGVPTDPTDTAGRLVSWLAGQDSGEGKFLVSGSTIMFSDYTYDETSNWIDQLDNLKLFQNIVAWLLNITPSDAETSDGAFDFIGFNLLTAFIIFAGILIIWLGSLIYNGRLSLSRILDIKLPKKTSAKKSKKTTTKGTKKKKTKKERRKRI